MNGLAQKELKKLKERIGEEVIVEYDVYEDDIYDICHVNYRMRVENVTPDCIEGVLCEETEWGHKGELISQPFFDQWHRWREGHSRDGAAEGCTIERVITLIKDSSNKILYDRRKERS